MSTWIVGVDAGGTQTRAVAAELETGLLRVERAEGANWTVHGAEICRRRIGAAVAAAVPPGAHPVGLSVCAAGFYPPTHAAEAESWLAACWPGVAARMFPDVAAAWAGALEGRPGLVLISGTGSICYGRNSRLAEVRAGGWGPLFGDQGSAYAVGLGCLRALGELVDGMGPATTLADRLPGRWPVTAAIDRSDTRGWLRAVLGAQWVREQIAALAEEAARAAEEGDAVAQLLVATAASDLARQALAVEKRLGEPDLPLAMQGGMCAGSPLLRDGIRRELAEAGSRLRIVDPRWSPAAGALLLAAEVSAIAGAVEGVRALLARTDSTLT